MSLFIYYLINKIMAIVLLYNIKYYLYFHVE